MRISAISKLGSVLVLSLWACDGSTDDGKDATTGGQSGGSGGAGGHTGGHSGGAGGDTGGHIGGHVGGAGGHTGGHTGGHMGGHTGGHAGGAGGHTGGAGGHAGGAGGHTGGAGGHAGGAGGHTGGHAGGAGGHTGGHAGGSVTPPCDGPNPQGCHTGGCEPGFRCTDDPNICVPSSCGCDEDTGQWFCTEDCGGGLCVPEAGACPGENPQGCVSDGCPEGQYCEVDVDTCASSGCLCDEATGQWVCLPDCGGGVCMPLGDTRWYLTCGDPVCRGHQPDPNIPPCDDAMFFGEACATPDVMCDPIDDCNARLVCTDVDPRLGPCPISKRAYKDDVRYLPPTEVDAKASALLSVKLAEYRYTRETPGGKAHLGFIIDDGVPGDALRPSGDQVDLYGYTSLAVAALQAQARQIATLEARLAQLEAELGARSGTCAPAR
ncbi:hypothetical protein L6V77_21130 [Myxococcota bacterium]|nr:hypothetical protein [Myxococcota bacterium]